MHKRTIASYRRRLHVRITAAHPEADVAAAVWPGVAALQTSLTESVTQVQAIETLLEHWERRRGLRPGTIAIEAGIDTVKGVTEVHSIVAGSVRARALLTRRRYLNLSIGIDDREDCASPDPLFYSEAECELAARAGNLEAALVELPLKLRRRRGSSGRRRRPQTGTPGRRPTRAGRGRLVGSRRDLT
jgi:citrate lyase beta subunit